MARRSLGAVSSVSARVDSLITDPTLSSADGPGSDASVGGIQNNGYQQPATGDQLLAANSDGKGVTSSTTDDVTNLKGDLQYTVDEIPPWYTTIILGLQHFLLMFSGVIAVPLILSGPLCVHTPEALTQLIGTIFFVSGMVTLLQSTFGVRLPIVQGGTFGFLLPTFAILDVRGPCMEYNPVNATATQEAEAAEFWQSRMREIQWDTTPDTMKSTVQFAIPSTPAIQIQGAIIIASMVQVILGCTGAIGLLLRFIGPLTIAPTIGLIGITLFGVAEMHMSSHWGIGFLTFILITIFSQLLDRVQIPLPGGRKFPIFTLFPIIISIIIAWIVCGILTAANVFPDDPDAYGYAARTDINAEALRRSPWFIFPYPGQWGLPTVTLAGFLGMTAAVVASMIESVGDYYACARLSGSPPPPAHAINRGIFVEGIGCILAGLWGTGNGTTSYSENIGAIGLTKVGSRVVIQACAILLMLVGVFGKLNALFSMIPQPVIGGVLAVTFGMVGAVGFSNLQFVNMNSSRNLFILGVSLFLGIAVPHYVTENSINTSNEQLNQILTVLLQTSMFVGGAAGMVLDNVIRGTPEERGLIKWIEATQDHVTQGDEDVRYSPIYNLPFVTPRLRQWNWTKYVPISPTFRGFRLKDWRSGDNA